MQYCAAAKSLQSCPTLCDPIDSSPPGSPVPGILQAFLTLENACRCHGDLRSASTTPGGIGSSQLVSQNGVQTCRKHSQKRVQGGTY